jgi:hypothetical protein
MIEIGRDYVEKLNTDEKVNTIVSFINNSHLYWLDEIKNRKEEFFLKHSNKIFSYFGNKINIFKTLFEDKKIINEEDRKTIWLYIESFVRQSIKYIHESRNPTRVVFEQKYQNVYTRSFMDDIPLSNYARAWNIKLEW